jgi:class 3 adenylate cyclase
VATSELKPNIRLMVTKGKDQGKVHETNRFPILIGRDPEADFILDQDPSISRRHAIIDVKENQLFIEDLNSTNGSFVNNIRISGTANIESGSTFILGKSWIEIVVLAKNKKEEKIDLSDHTTSYIETKKTEAIFVLDRSESTKLADKYGDDASMKMTEALNNIAIPTSKRCKSTYIKGTGDGFMITFQRPDKALEAAEDILGGIRQYNKGKKEGHRLDIRIGMSYGSCNIEPDEDRHSHAINMAFRIEGIQYRDLKKDRKLMNATTFPKKDRILVSKDFYEILKPIDRDKFKYIGKYKLKGFSGTHPIYQFK